jgi:hypothetical protein
MKPQELTQVAKQAAHCLQCAAYLKVLWRTARAEIRLVAPTAYARGWIERVRIGQN